MIIGQKITELHERGFCVLKAHFPKPLVEACREAFWPTLLDYLDTHYDRPNRGPNRHYLPAPFEPPYYAPEFFFDNDVLSMIRGVMDDRAVADQWGCDVPLQGSEYQQFHADYQHPLFAEAPELSLPPYILNASFGLVQISSANGPIEIAPGTHRISRNEAVRAIESTKIETESIYLEIGDVLIRHPWALHRGTPNKTAVPRPLMTVRYVRRWYTDSSRDVNSIPLAVWRSLTLEQQAAMRFPLGE